MQEFFFLLFVRYDTTLCDHAIISGLVAEGARLIGSRAALQIPQAKNRYGKIDGRGDEKLCAFFYVSARVKNSPLSSAARRSTLRPSGKYSRIHTYVTCYT